MPARRGSNNTDLVRVDLVFRSVGPDNADGTLGILKRYRMLVWGVAVFKYKARDSLLVKPLGDGVTFMIHRETAVTASGTDDGTRTIGTFFFRKVYGERGCVDITDPSFVLFASVVLDLSGYTVWPYFYGFRPGM
jgi:hypothetical protein